MSRVNKVYICTGHAALDEDLKNNLTEVETEIISMEELDRAAGGALIWTNLLAKNDLSVAKAYLDTMQKSEITSIMICPHKEWIEEFDTMGYTGFILVEDGEITVDAIYEMLGLKQEEAPAFRVVGRKKENKQTQPERDTVYHAFWSAKPGMGVSTLSQTVAIDLAKRGRKVLFVEWDSFYPDAAFRWGLAGERHGLQKYAQDVAGNPSVLSYILDKSTWTEEYNAKEFRDAVRQLPNSLSLFAVTNIDLKKPATLTAEQVQSLLSQFEGHFDDVVMDVPSELIHAATVPSLHRADAVYILLDDKSTHLLLTMKAIEAAKNIFEDKFQYIVNRTDNQEVLAEIRDAFGKAPLLTLPFVESMGKNSYEMPFASDKGYLQAVQALVKYMAGETDEVVLEAKKVRTKKEKRAEKEKPNRLMEFLSLKRQEA